MQTSVHARMQTEGRSDERRRLWTPNKNLKDGLPFLLKDLPVRGLVARAARLRPPPRLTVTANFCCGGVDTRLLKPPALQGLGQVQEYLWEK